MALEEWIEFLQQRIVLLHKITGSVTENYNHLLLDLFAVDIL